MYVLRRLDGFSEVSAYGEASLSEVMTHLFLGDSLQASVNGKQLCCLYRNVDSNVARSMPTEVAMDHINRASL